MATDYVVSINSLVETARERINARLTLIRHQMYDGDAREAAWAQLDGLIGDAQALQADLRNAPSNSHGP
jgi:hypothetical protein